jgi:hypothetical protein
MFSTLLYINLHDVTIDEIIFRECISDDTYGILLNFVHVLYYNTMKDHKRMGISL